MASLDIDLLRTFVRVADTRSFTDAGDGLGATQSAVSTRLKKLEDRLGARLMNRTPRSVDLTAFGERFLPDARRILSAHDEALNRALGQDRTVVLRLGASEHLGSHHLTAVLARLKRAMPGLRISVTLGLSHVLAGDLAAGRFDAVIVRRFAGGGERDERVLFRDPLQWVVHPDVDWRAGDTVPLVSVARPCQVCGMAVTALEAAGIAWEEAFFSPGLSAVRSAIEAGLGIGCLGRSVAPPGVRVLGRADGLPELPESELVLLTRTADGGLRRILATLGDELAAEAAGGTE